MVGVTAIGVNRYLARTHASIIEGSLPSLQAANRIAASVELAQSLITRLVEAETPSSLDQAQEAINRSLRRARASVAELEGLFSGRPLALDDSGIENLTGRLADLQRRRLELSRQITVKSAEQALHGSQLSALVIAEIELSRLRITSGIFDLYTGREADNLSRLDRLADRDFFAFERLTELIRTIDMLRLTVQQIANLPDFTSLAAARQTMENDVQVAEERIFYLPTARAQHQVDALIATYRDSLATTGLLALQWQMLDLNMQIASLVDDLASEFAVFTDTIEQTGAEVQSSALAQIERTETMSSRLFMILLGLVLASTALGMWLLHYARSQLVKRLRTVSTRVIDIAQGEFGRPLTITGYDEISRMEKALNILRRRALEAAQLRKSLEEAVVARTGEVVAQLQVSDTARAEAEAANASKSEFLARMSHEIRTPLSGLIGMLDLLQASETDQARKSRVKTALDSARDLLAIANDILNYASSDTETNRGNPVHFNLRAFVGQLHQQLIALAEGKGLTAVVDLKEPAPQVLFGDSVKLRQIVGNLISNAVKYTDGGTVALEIEVVSTSSLGAFQLHVSVNDTGIGMTPEAVAHAFDPYSRAEAVRQAGTDGVGLGLAISSNLTSSLGGSLKVQSAPGVGSQFTLSVPLALGDPELVQGETESTVSAELQKTVLVIDDHAVNRMVARGYLERLGCRVEEAATAAKGLELCGQLSFDCVLIDLDLPDKAGGDLAAELGQQDCSNMLVLLTAHHIEDDETNRQAFHVSRILSKPISPQTLLEILSGQPSSSDTGRPVPGDVLQSVREDVRDIGAENTARIITEFLGDLPGALDGILTADRAVDQRKAAHKLKGAAANFRLDALCQTLASIEKVAPDIDEALAAEAKAKMAEAKVLLMEAADEEALQVCAGSTNR